MIYFFFFKPSFESGATTTTIGYDAYFYDAYKKRREERAEDDEIEPATVSEIETVEEIVETTLELEAEPEPPNFTPELNSNIHEFSKLSLKLRELELNLQKVLLEEELKAKMLEAQKLLAEERARVAKIILMMQEEEEAMFMLLMQ